MMRYDVYFLVYKMLFLFAKKSVKGYCIF